MTCATNIPGVTAKPSGSCTQCSASSSSDCVPEKVPAAILSENMGTVRSVVRACSRVSSVSVGSLAASGSGDVCVVAIAATALVAAASDRIPVNRERKKSAVSRSVKYT